MGILYTDWVGFDKRFIDKKFRKGYIEALKEL